MNALEYNNVGFRYREAPLLESVQWTVKEQSIAGIIGPNGSGKTTLFKLATGLLQPQTGNVLVHGKNIHRMRPTDIAKTISLVPQMEQMIFPYTVRTMVTFGRFPYDSGPGFTDKEGAEHVDHALELCGVLDLAERVVTELSGGELHRVLFARAFAQDTSVLLLDEPTAFMDITYQVSMFELLLRMQKEFRKTIICVTHDLNLAMMYFDDVALLNDGTIVCHGAPPEILTEERLKKHFNVDVQIKTFENDKPFIRLQRYES